uniref:Uncharacterized protein n=1 Tax=Anopheles atroparvus TaxID=41427 RepID=A0A182IMR0_ANOAO
MAESQRPRGQCTVGVNVQVNSPEAERQGGASDSAATDGGLSPDRQRRSLAPANHPTESGIPSAAVNGQSPKPVQRRPPYDNQQGESSGPAATERGPSPDPTRTAPASASTSDVSSNGFHGYASYEVNAPTSWKPDDAVAPETTGNEDTTRIIEALRRKLARGQAENEEMQLQLRELEEMTSPVPSLVTIGGEETLVTCRGQQQTCRTCSLAVHHGMSCTQGRKLITQKAGVSGRLSYAASLVTSNASVQQPSTPKEDRTEIPRTAPAPDTVTGAPIVLVSAPTVAAIVPSTGTAVSAPAPSAMCAAPTAPTTTQGTMVTAPSAANTDTGILVTTPSVPVVTSGKEAMPMSSSSEIEAELTKATSAFKTSRNPSPSLPCSSTAAAFAGSRAVWSSTPPGRVPAFEAPEASHLVCGSGVCKPHRAAHQPHEDFLSFEDRPRLLLDPHPSPLQILAAAP